jgi:serine/threonine-protein kinase
MQTMSGTLKGKFGYMAPEYIAGHIDARADLFALGVIAHELFTNHPLFSTGEEVETLQRVRSMNIPAPSALNPAVPKEVEEIVMTALSRDPEARWQAATALRTAMTTVTKRLNLEIHNPHVAEWIQWLYAHTPAQPGDEVDSLIEHATQKSVKKPPGSSEQVTALRTRGSAPRPPAVAQGTPHRMTAQGSSQANVENDDPTSVRSVSKKIAAPTPTIPGMMQVPTRPSRPQLAAQPSQHHPIPTLPGRPPARASHPPQVAPQRSGNLVVVMVLVLLVAAAVAAGVYFGLPLLRS